MLEDHDFGNNHGLDSILSDFKQTSKISVQWQKTRFVFVIELPNGY